MSAGIGGSLVTTIPLLLTVVSCSGLGTCSRESSNSQPVQTSTLAQSSTNSNSVLRGNEQVSAEQTSFGAEETILRPVEIPADVLQILRHDDRNRRVLKLGESENDIVASWFVASAINLDDNRLPGLIVQSANPRLFGANLVPFWVFHKTSKGNELALRIDALRLEVLRTKTNGVRDIRVSEATANEIISSYYEFDGTRYEQHRSYREPIKQ
jgi:hypothetical protein